MKSLLSKNLTQFIICTGIILILVTPLFYFLTKYYYAEDMIDLIEAVQNNKPLPAIDIEEDIIMGIMIQFALISFVLGISLILTMRLISKHSWAPFDKTLKQLEYFNLEHGELPKFSLTNIKEFNSLNKALTHLIENNIKSYITQKEFIENASHELQTPIAIFQSKLDMLLQEPNMSEEQAKIVQSLYEISGRLARLNKNLLLLSKIDNGQYKQVEIINISDVLKKRLAIFEDMTKDIVLHQNINNSSLLIKGNQILLESMINNLIVNSVRHNKKDGEVNISIINGQLSVCNTSTEGELNKKNLFHRFSTSSQETKGNGLGLAIIKAICDYHNWQINYDYKNNMHCFIVKF